MKCVINRSALCLATYYQGLQRLLRRASPNCFHTTRIPSTLYTYPVDQEIYFDIGLIATATLQFI